MTVATVLSRALNGMHAPLVRVEVHLANGLPAVHTALRDAGRARKRRAYPKRRLRSVSWPGTI